MRNTLLVLLVAVVSSAYSWNIPNLPSGKRTQFYVLHNDGGYKYGYDTDKDYFAKQAADAQNEVSGHYVYKDVNGRDVDVKYTAGVHGFVPEGLDRLPKPTGPHGQGQFYLPPVVPEVATYASEDSSSQHDDQSNTGDSSYSFSIDTDTYKRHETSDPSGNVQGKYSYVNNEGQHDLNYIAGSNTGFVATSGSLSVPNGLSRQMSSAGGYSPYPGAIGRYAPSEESDHSGNTDGSYAFQFSTGDQSRQEQSDASGNVQGRYSFTNEAGTHDLSYVAGSATGFKPIGGSLASPNGLEGKSVFQSQNYAPQSGYSYGKSSSADYTPTIPNADGSYSYSFSTDDQSRQEQSDASGNVQGRYSFTNEAGTHDLSYVAGSATGFKPVGGSLANPNGLEGRSVPSLYHASQSGHSFGKSASAGYTPTIPNPDGSYSFSYATGDQSRQEKSDASGNVQGRYSYTNPSGTHDLSYVAGSQTGFLPVGGSLASANGLSGKSVSTYSTASGDYDPTTYSEDSVGTIDDQSNTGDASYSFTIDTDEYIREESSDPSGNVKGRFSYKNPAGQHDLSFVAGSETGFLPTGGSLSVPNGLEGKDASAGQAYSASYQPTAYASGYQQSQDAQANSGDASYHFSIDTPEYQRHESSDSQGNVKGSFAYKSGVGTHDLSFVAGANTGFVPTGGSLSVPNGVSRSSVPVPVGVPAAATKFLPPQARAHNIFSGPQPVNHFETRIGSALVKTYLPPQSNTKYGYVFDNVA